MDGQTALVVLAVATMATGVATFDFRIVPQRGHVLPGGNITIRCEADVHLSDCRFYLPALGYLDPNPSRVTVHKATTFEYSSHDTMCSITMRGVSEVFYNLIACRGRDDTGVYKAVEMSLAVTRHEPFALEIDSAQRIGVVSPGGEFSMVCRSPRSLINCSIWIPGDKILDLSMGPMTVADNQYPFKLYEYHGLGLDKGECGIKFKNVTEQLNGVVWCSAMPESLVTQFDYLSLIVTHPPETIRMDVNGSYFVEGDTLIATCSAEYSRPASTITWFMGDDVIHVGVADVVPESPYWPDAHNKMSVTQRLTRTLGQQDDGKDLRCVVKHVALSNGGSETTKRIHVKSELQFTFVAKPQRAHVLIGGDVTITCESNIALSDCRFWLPKLGFLDLSTRLQPNATRTYTYHGTNIAFLWRGTTCGVTLTKVSTDFDDVVSCRGRSQSGSYKTAEMALAVSNLTPFALDIDRRQATVLPGQNYTLLCRSPLPLTYCAIWLPDETILDLTAESDSLVNKIFKFGYKYHGTGLAEGQCGVTFWNITAELNGQIWCEGQSSDTDDQSDYMTLIVAKRPNPPELVVSPEVYNVGDTIEASCVVGNSRPAATIAWFLAGQSITNGLHPGPDTTESPTWSWDYDIQTVSQNLTLRLREEDDGKELRCVAKHIAQSGGQVETNFKIQFTTLNNSSDVSLHPNRKLINPDKCGYIHEDRRIFNGNETRLFQFPWMAIILYDSKDGVRFGCGGSLITDRYVLTAAHCVSSLPSGWTMVGVRLGEHDYDREIDCQDVFGEFLCAPPPQNFTIVKATTHTLFSSTKLNNDLALVKLDSPAMFSDAVRPICLPVGTSEQMISLTEKWLVVAGWGVTEMGAQSSSLRAVLVPVVANSICADNYVKRKYLVGTKQICAGGMNGQDSCKGDSGGPLMMVDSIRGSFVQYGVVSYGAGVCGTSVPTVYTHVGQYMKWILDNLQ